MLKGFKYRLYPTPEQQMLLNKHFGCVRFVYNWALETKTKAYVENKKSLSCFDLITQLPSLKKENEWLNEVNSQALQMSIRNLDNAYTNFFRRVKDKSKTAGFPKFKNRKNRQSFQCPQKVKIDFDKETISLIKIPNIKAVFHRRFEGDWKTVTISKTKSGKFFASVLVETQDLIPLKSSISEKTAIGIDLGIKDFAILSNGEKIANQRFNERVKRKIAKLNRKMAKQKKMNGGKHTNNREKTRVKLARTYEKIENQRTAWLHTLSTKIVRENQTICLEDLAVQNMMKNHCLAGSIASVAWSTFVRMLEYKCEWYGKNLLTIGRFEPSSKICGKCGWYNKSLTLKDREWTCSDCGSVLDRDVNAANNIKTFALHNQNLIREKIPLHKREFTLGEIEACKDQSKNQEQAPRLALG